MLTEAEGCQVLWAVFTARGFSIAENQPFSEGGFRFDIDGWDASARVGYEYLTREAGDFEALSPDALAELGSYGHRRSGANDEQVSL